MNDAETLTPEDLDVIWADALQDAGIAPDTAFLYPIAAAVAQNDECARYWQRGRRI